MKKINFVLVLIGMASNFMLGWTQNPILSLPNNYNVYDTILNWQLAPLPSLLSPYTSNHNAYPAPDGSLGFYVVDEYVYDGNGALVGAMWLPTNSGGSQWPETRGFSEIAIAPHPTDCNRFYIMSANTQYWQNTPLAVEITYQPNSIPKYAMTDTIDLIQHLEAQAGVPLFAVNPYDATGLFYAVSPDLINGKRVFYISNGVHSIIKASISNSGIQYESHFSISTTGVSARTEMELFKKSSGYILAIPYQESNINNNILLLDLDVNGDFIPNSEKFISLPYNSASNLNYVVHGLEFSPNGKYLYFTGKTNGLPGLGVFNYVNLLDTTLTPVPLALSTNSDFQYSHIELGLDGKLYFAHSGGLASYSNPDNPGMGTFVQNAVVSSYPQSNFWNGSTPVYSAFTLPDQIDGFDYIGNYANNQACCVQNSSYDIESYISLLGTHEWKPGQNPLTSTINNTVYIRDSLIIDYNSKVTIKNMVLKFAPGAYVRIKGGLNGQQGGKLTLDNTIFTVDSTCKFDFWKGVIVMGDKNKPQGNISNSEQGWLKLTNNSIIEYAEIGARTGEIYNNTYLVNTGGVIQSINSSFKNNLISVKIGQYDNVSANFFRNSEFTTTRKLTPQPLEPKYIELYNVNTVNITGCTFHNKVPELYGPDYYGTGVYGAFSNVIIGRYCTDFSQPAGLPCNGIDSKFINLKDGIKVQTTKYNKLTVNEALFIDNLYGIRVQGNHNPIITGCEFYIKKDSVLKTVGAYLTSVPNFDITENYFTESGGDEDPNHGESYGLIIDNSGQNMNTVYRNTFSNLKVGSQAQRVNGLLTDSFYNSAYGLRFICNNYTDSINKADIAVTSGRIAHLQGVETSLSSDPFQKHRAGNIFSNSTYTLANNYWLNPGVLEIVYNHHLNSSLYKTEPVLRDTNVYTHSGLAPYDPSKNCLSKEYPKVTFSDKWIIKSKIDSVKSDFDLMSSLIDCNNRETYWEQLENNEDYDVYNSLFSCAPYVSDLILLELIDRAVIEKTDLETLLISCSPLSDNVKQKYSERYGSIISEDLESIQEGYPEAPRQELMRSLEVLKIEMNDFYEEGIKFIANDTTSDFSTEVLSFIDESSSKESVLTKIEIFLSLGDYRMADNLTSQLEENSLEAGFYGFIIPYYENNFETLNGATNEVIVNFLDSLSEYTVIPHAFLLYTTIAKQDSFYFEIEPLIENVSKSIVKPVYNGGGIGELKTYTWSVFPNPTQSSLTIIGLIPDENYIMEVIDLNGRILKSQRVFNNEQMDVSGLESGLYFFKLNNTMTGKVETRSFVKVK